MKNSILKKRLSHIGTAVATAGIFMTAPIPAQAVPLNWLNLDGGAQTGPFIFLDKLNTIASPQLYSATHNVGADNILNDGDSFSESLTLLTNSSSLGAGGVDFRLGGDYRFEVSLLGTIANAGGTPIMINPDNTVSSDATSVFDVVFDSATIGLFNNITNEHIANLDFTSGGGSQIQLVADSFIGDITINALLGTSCVNCDPYIRDEGGSSIIGSSILTITTGSTRFLSFAGSDFATNTLIANFQDNGESSTFVVPEPGSLALIGLGLLGLGIARRTRKSS